MGIRRFGAVLALSVLAITLAPVRPAPAATRYTEWGQYGGVWDGIWEDANHWSATTLVPDNATGHSWWCDFNAGARTYFVEVSQNHTVTTITANTTTGHVELTNWTGGRVWLQFTEFTNTGALDVNNIDLYGAVYNQGDWTVRGGMVNYNGDFTNHAGALLHAKGNLDVKGDVTNDGEIRSYAFGSLVTDSCVNHDRVSLLGGSLTSDAPFTNSAGAGVGGAGSLFAPTGIDNAGSIVAETGTLSVYCGALANTGRLENLPNASLLIEADSVDHQGTLVVGSGGGVTFTSCDLENKAAAGISLLGGTLAAPNLTNKDGADFSGFGCITANLTNQGLIDLYGPSQIVGDVHNQTGAELGIRNADLLIAGDTVNDGTILAVNGKVYFEGNLINNATLTMDPSLAVVVGNLTVGTSGVLTADAGSTYQMMGHFDNRSTRAAEFDLAVATVEFICPDPAAGPSDVEVAGKDLGVAPGAWTDNFTAGTLKVGNETWAGRVRLVDAHDNHGDGQPESLYVHNLAIAADSTLDANGRRIYLDGSYTNDGTLDLATGSLSIDYDGASPFDAIAEQIRSGLHDGPTGYWDGPGINSSAAAEYPDGLTAVGVIDDGETVIVDYTWWGDANLDGIVDAADYDLIDTAWLLGAGWDHWDPGPRWAIGDFNWDGVIDAADYDLIDKAWLLSGGAVLGGSGAPAPTPEPATLALLGFGLAARLLMRWSRQGARDTDTA